jgi:tetratricopeptide (TPR) repeat protein
MTDNSAGVSKPAAAGEPTRNEMNNSQITEVFEKAYKHYQIVMAAANTGRITPAVENDLYEALKWLDELCDLDVTHGEPRGLRGTMYMILAQIERQTGYLNKAQEDYTTAIKLGSRDQTNISVWRNSLEDVQRLRRLL